MDKQDIIKYVMKTPENTNPAVLGDLLDQMGGGNPNYVETVTGTAANPWGDVSLDVLTDAILAGNATVYIKVDGSALDLGTQEYYVQNRGIADGYLPFGACGFRNNNWMAGLLIYNIINKGLSTSKILFNNVTTDLAPYASLIPTEITIIHHPLPEDST